MDSIYESLQEKTFTSYSDLVRYLDNDDFVPTTKDDVNIQQVFRGGKTWAIQENHISNFMDKLEKCRRIGCELHFAERQQFTDTPNSGIFIDLDIITNQKNPDFAKERQSSFALHIVKEYLMKDLVFDNVGENVNFNIFYTVRPNTVPLDQNLYKWGIHIYIPHFKVTVGYKKFLLHRLRADTFVQYLFSDIHVDDKKNPLDIGCAANPSMLFGSCKKKENAEAYRLESIFSVKIKARDVLNGYFEKTLNTIPEIDVAAMKDYNLTYELSLNYEAVYSNKEAFNKKIVYQVKPELEPKISTYSLRTQNNIIPLEEIMEIDRSLSILRMNDPDIKDTYNLLEVLSENYARNYDEWFEVMTAIANATPANEQDNYLLLAEFFSQKCPEKYGNVEKTFSEMYNNKLKRRSNNQPLISLNTIRRKLRLNNEKDFQLYMNNTIEQVLFEHIVAFDGRVSDYIVSKLLFMMFKEKFVTIAEKTSSATHFVWYEFITPDRTAPHGSIWKWTEMEPSKLKQYIPEMFPEIFKRIQKKITNKIKSFKEKLDDMSADPEANTRDINEIKASIKYFEKLIKNMKTDLDKLNQIKFCNNVVKFAEALFKNDEFALQMNRDTHMFGVGNGVVMLGGKNQFIDYAHNSPITLFTKVEFCRFDPMAKYTGIFLNFLRAVMPQQDARNYILKFLASSLDGQTKRGLCLFLLGEGANGKSTLLNVVHKALGSYSRKVDVSIFTSNFSADKPNPALYATKNGRLLWSEETEDQRFNASTFKQIISPGSVISCRTLNKEQETFEIIGNFVFGTNKVPNMDWADFAIKRRCKFYIPPNKFVPNPTRDNEMKADARFENDYPNNPLYLSAVLSVLFHYYERLQVEDNGNILNCKSPTIDRLTETVIDSQDYISKYIHTMLVVSPQYGESYPTLQIAKECRRWILESENSRFSMMPVDIEKKIITLLKKYMNTEEKVIHGVRLLTKDDMNLRSGEQYFGMNNNNVQAVVEDNDNEWYYHKN